VVRRGKYELKRRAERREETRARIARATLELHETVGPSLTTISAIAERAGVGRPTVYSHFPDELSLFKACSSLDLLENPLPDPAPWAKISDPEERLRSALIELYAYFRRREGLWTNIMRDEEMPRMKVNPDVQEIMQPFFAHWGRMRETLAAGWRARDSRATRPQLHDTTGRFVRTTAGRYRPRALDCLDVRAAGLDARGPEPVLASLVRRGAVT